jgi:competence protein ComEC
MDVWLSLAVVSVAIWSFFVLKFCREESASQHEATRQSARLAEGQQTIGRWISVMALLLGWFCLSGAWHHWRWSCRANDDIVNWATDEPQFVRVIGKVVQTPWIVRRPDADRAEWQNPERTILVIECREIRSDTQPLFKVSGLARVSIDGSLANLTYGDIVEITGELVRPSEPANPGDFDQRSFLRAQGVSAVIRSNHVESVVMLTSERTVWDRLLALRGAVRKRAETLIESWLGSDTAPVAQAMLLGSRVQIDDETRRAFRESGMLHILAISGMNVGLLWSWLWSLSRWMGRSARTSIWIVLIALPVYAMVTDANPPIVRATIVAVIVAFGQMIGRSGSIANALAIAGLAVLACNPSDLFNTGAQLSFLAVFAILHATNWLTLLHQQTLKTNEDAPLRDSFVRRNVLRLTRAAIEANVVGIAVWTMTSPLVASEFHLVSPIGSLLTVLLIVPVTLMFWIGYSFLLLGLVWSSAFGWLGSLFDLCLRGFLWTVHAGASLQLGHMYVPAPPIWWTTGFYALTLLPILVIHHRRWGAALSVRAGLTWMVIGLSWGLRCPPHPGVTCTFISVGHGLGVLIECPNGRTVLYDAGGMVGGGSIARTISQTLWATGRSRLDAVVISHADGDHCNALPELSRIVSPGGLFVHKSFLDWKQPAVSAAIERTVASGTTLRLIAEGQSIGIDPDVSLSVLHPPHDFHSPKDNPNSVVLCLKYAGRRVLLTGDLELEGLTRLLTLPHVDVDVLLSPHHGSLKANPPDLARWATPKYVIVSTPEPATAERLATRFGPETEILTTARHGAIRCHISPDGGLQVVPFKRLR